MSGLVRAQVAGLLSAALVVGTAACVEQPIEPDPSEDSDEDEPPAEPPEILDALEREVSAAAREDITIAAAGLLSGARVELDGQSWPLTGAGPVTREGQTIRVPLAGAMVVGEHELVLVNTVENKQLRSEPLTIRVTPAELSPLAASLDPDVIGTGDRVVELGPGERLLALVDDVDATIELRLGGWATPGVQASLPGLAANPGPAGSGVDVTIAEVDGARWLITAWLADDGARALGRVTPLLADDELGEPGEPRELWSLAEPDHRALLGPHELALNHGVALLDRLLVVAVEARRDAEAQSPGDRRLAIRWLAADGSLADPQVIRGAGGRDLDLPQRARLWLDQAELGPALSLRVALAFPWLLELAGNGLPVVTADPGEQAAAPARAVWMASADGALGARHAFALTLDEQGARVHVLRIDRWGAAGIVEAPSVAVVELPAAPIGPPSLGLIAGTPTLVVGLGPGEPSLAVRTTGEAPLLDSLAELECDALLLAQADVDGEGDDATLACLAAGELRLGALGQG